MPDLKMPALITLYFTHMMVQYTYCELQDDDDVCMSENIPSGPLDGGRILRLSKHGTILRLNHQHVTQHVTSV
jgi:hypothetical protein